MIEFLKGTVTPIDLGISGGIVALAAALCAVFVFVVMLPQRTTLVETQESIDQKKTDVMQAQITAKNIDQLREEAADMQALVDVFEKRLPEEEEIPSLLETFESLGYEVGLDVNLDSGTRILDERKETFPYKVTALGDFHQIVQFINLLERYQRYLKISNLDIAEQEAGISEAKFDLSTYRFVEAASEEEKAKKEKT